MASNRKVVIKRIMERNAKGKIVWNMGLFRATGFGNRELVGVVEGTYQDAVLALKRPRTEGGHSIKGFKRLKDVKDDA